MTNQPPQEISTERKGIYYLGMVLIVLGVLLFVSNFFFVFSSEHSSILENRYNVNLDQFHQGPSWSMSSFEDKARGMMFRSLGGMGLIVVGGILMAVGRAGPAGAGLILDPQKRREDLAPWNRAAGGMLSDTLDEVKVVQQVAGGLSGTKEVVKVRCPNCKTLNDEAAKFCNQCGQAI